MHCEQAQRLFDAYLDGELSPALATELGAHRVQCSDCRRALALLEVSEHILSSDRDPVSVDAAFTDRLVACVKDSPHSWHRRIGRWFYIGVPVAAAAVIALAFIGVFDHRDGQEVAGDRVVASFDDLVKMQTGESVASTAQRPAGQDQLLQDAQRSLELKKQSMQSLQKVLDLTLQQPLDLLEQSRPDSTGASVPVASPPQAPATSSGPSKPGDELEDL